MLKRVVVLKCGFLGVLGLLALAQPAAAHPHVWIDVRSTLMFDDEGRIEAVRQRWTFDDLYTLFVVEGLTKDHGAVSRAALDDLARQNVTNLAEYSWFTFIEVAGVPPRYGPAEDYANVIEGGRLMLSFTLPLAEPVDPLMQNFVLRVYDPTYYISLLHEDASAITLEGGADPACHAELQEAEPDMETLSLAAALDRNQTAGDGLGVLFAQTVAVRCE